GGEGRLKPAGGGAQAQARGGLRPAAPRSPLTPQQKGVGMHEPLVDAEGFPRADIDLYQVRTARHNVICEWGRGG
uniref:Nas2 N-terminal domain-containing protein n=1 Tax=Falco tinnunculus TaxID=100819 RepID=A0A8C4TVS5_FALTI